MNSHSVQTDPSCFLDECKEAPSIPEPRSDFYRAEQPDGYYFDVPHNFYCSISGDIIIIPVQNSRREPHYYEASHLSKWLTQKCISPLTNLRIEKVIAFDSDFYLSMRDFFRNLLETDKEILNDGLHADSLKLMTSYANGAYLQSIFELRNYCRENHIQLIDPGSSLFLVQGSGEGAAPVESSRSSVPAESAYVLPSLLPANPPLRALPRREAPSVAARLPFSNPHFVLERDILLMNVLSVGCGWVFAGRYSLQTACEMSLIPPASLFPISLIEYGCCRRPGMLIGTATSVFCGLSTVLIASALQDEVGVWASPIINLVPAVATVFLPRLWNSTENFRANLHGFWNRPRRDIPAQPVLEPVIDEQIARIV